LQAVFQPRVLPDLARDFLFQPGFLAAQQLLGARQFDLGADPGDEHGRLDRLGDEVGGAFADAALLLLGVVHGGDENHRDVAGQRVLAQFGEHHVAVHVRHHDVEQDEVGARRQLGQAQGGRAVSGNPHLAAFVLDDGRDDHQVAGRVVNDKDHRLFAVDADQSIAIVHSSPVVVINTGQPRGSGYQCGLPVPACPDGEASFSGRCCTFG
jgi:hypothetical protein